MAATDASRDRQGRENPRGRAGGEQSFRRIVEGIPDIVWTARSDGTVDFVNRRWRRVTGLAAAESMGQGWLDAVHPDDRDLVRQAWHDAVDAGASYACEFRLRTADGVWRWYVSRAEPEQNGAGGVAAWFGTMTEIQAQKQAEAARRQGERFTRRVLDNLFTFAGLLTLDGTLLLTNEAPLRAAGINLDDVQGKKFWDCYWWNYDSGVQEHLRAACARAAAGETVRYDVEVRMAGGVRVPIDFQMAPLRDEAGRVTHLIPSAVDIAERQAAAEALRERERRFREMADDLPLMIWLHDAQGRQEFVNQTFCDYFGVSREEMRDHRWQVFTHPEDGSGYIEVFAAAVARQQPFHAEVRVQRADGQWRWIESWGRPRFDDDGSFLGHIGTSADVTERKEAEEALRQSEERLRLAAEATGFGWYDYDFYSGKAIWSDRLKEIVGVDIVGPVHPDELMSRVHPADEARYIQENLEAVDPRGPGVHEMEFRLVRDDGRTRWLRDNGRTYFSGAGDDRRPARVVGMVSDITVRKQAEEALRESRERLAFILENSEDNIFLQDLDLRYVWLARPAQPFTREDYLGRTDLEMAGPREQRELLTSLKRQVVETGEPLTTELTLSPLGQRRHFHAAYKPWLNGVGEVIGLAGYVRDITERKEAEDALRESEATLAATFAALPVGVAVVDVAGQILTMNPAGLRLHGFSSEEEMFKGLGAYEGAFELRYPDGRLMPVEEWPLSRAIAGDFVHDYEVQLRRPDGVRRNVVYSVVPIRSGPEPGQQVIFVIHDITARKAAEAALREREEFHQVAAEAAQVGTWDLDLRTGDCLLSPQMGELMEYGREQQVVPQSQWMASVHPEDRPLMESALAGAVAAVGSFELEYRIQLRDGSARWLYSKGSVSATGADGDLRLHGATVNITPLKEAEQALRRGAARDAFRVALADALRPLTDADEVERVATEMLGNYLGASRVIYGEIESEANVAIVRAEYCRDDVASVAAEHRLGDFGLFAGDTFASGRGVVVEDLRRLPDLTPQMEAAYKAVGLRAHASVPLVKGNRLTAFLSVQQSSARRWSAAEVALVEEVAERTWGAIERIRAEEALRQNERLLQAILEQMPSGVSVAEAPSGRLLFHNEEAARILGHTLVYTADPSGYAQYHAVHKDGTAYAAQEYPLARALYGETVQQAEMDYRRGDGSLITLSVNAAPVRNREGQIIRAVSTFYDISELKQAQEALRRLNETLEARVEQRTRQVRELARQLTMSEQDERRRISQILHDDLQQLLYGIEMKLSMVRQDLQENHDPTLAQDIEEGRAWVREAIGKTRQLTVDLSPPILQNEGLADALLWLQSQMRELHRLDVTIEADRHFTLPDDLRVLLFQIVRELLFNVKKHAGVDRATVRLVEEESHLVIHVIDEGQGFDLDALVAVAGPDRDGRVAGYGLYNMRERLNLLGGRLEVRSEPGQGTHVVVHAPQTA